MIYTLQVGLSTDIDIPAKTLEPIMVKTFGRQENRVNDAEIELVADAFKAQIKDLLSRLVNRGG